MWMPIFSGSLSSPAQIIRRPSGVKILPCNTSIWYCWYFSYSLFEICFITLSPIKTAGIPRLPQLTPQTPTYPSSDKIGGGIIKLYQSRCFYIDCCWYRCFFHIHYALDSFFARLFTPIHTPIWYGFAWIYMQIHEVGFSKNPAFMRVRGPLWRYVKIRKQAGLHQGQGRVLHPPASGQRGHREAQEQRPADRGRRQGAGGDPLERDRHEAGI